MCTQNERGKRHDSKRAGVLLIIHVTLWQSATQGGSNWKVLIVRLEWSSTKKKKTKMRKSISCSNVKQSIDEEDRPHWGLGEPPRSRRHPSSATAVSRTTSSASRAPPVVVRRTKTKKVGREKQQQQQQQDRQQRYTTHQQQGLYRHRSSLVGYEDDDLAARAAASRQQRKFAFACQRSWAYTTDEEYEVRECIDDTTCWAAVLPHFFFYFLTFVLFVLFLSSSSLK